MTDFLAHLPDGGLWLSGVVAGLVALGWLLRKAWRGYRKLDAFMTKAEVVLDIAEYEMQHNGGGSIKDSSAMVPGIKVDVGDIQVDMAALKIDVAALKEGAKVLRAGAVGIAESAAEMRQALAAHVEQANDIHEEQAAAISHLAEALPIVARSTPHPDDAID